MHKRCMVEDDLRFVGWFRTRDWFAWWCTRTQVWRMIDGIKVVLDFIRTNTKCNTAR